jgi:putative nucleotidyltransferase with HDIG domain
MPDMTITTEKDFAASDLPLDPTGYGGLVLDRLARQACEVVGAEQSCIMVRDPGDPRVAIAAAGHGVGEDLLGSRVVLDRGAVGHAFAFGRMAAGRGPDSNPCGRVRWDGAPLTACAPIGSKNEVMGALSATCSEVRRQFTDNELSLLRELAGLVADALGHAGTRDGRRADVATQLDRAVARLASHDLRTSQHSAAMVGTAMTIGERLGLSDASLLELELAVLLHDLGKVAVPGEILSKPGPLDPCERQVVQRHPVVGAEILRQITGLEPVATIVRYHHERWDGDGYPSGLAGERIPLASRIVSVCDAFEAMMSDRPYRGALGSEGAIAELETGAGAQFDPQVVEAFGGCAP